MTAVLVPIIVALLIALLVAYGIKELSPDPKFTNIGLLVVLLVFLIYVAHLFGLV